MCIKQQVRLSFNIWL